MLETDARVRIWLTKSWVYYPAYLSKSCHFTVLG
jgi:hypothetical protein